MRRKEDILIRDPSVITFGKIKSIQYGSGNYLGFKYDGLGNRISKEYSVDRGEQYEIYYIKDAQGNVMATYKSDANGVKLIERPLYGSSRLGVFADTIQMVGASAVDTTHQYRHLGKKLFELTNHLGNVLTVFTDRKAPGYNETFETITYHTVDHISSFDYYPFGMEIKERTFNDSVYRYAFNGKEKDDEVKGVGNSYDFDARIYDPRLGRWLSLDPLQTKYPHLSPYHAMANNPILVVDKDGKENTIYLVVLPSAKGMIDNGDAQKIADQANKNFDNMGLKTRVVVFTQQDFNIKNLDKTDGVAVLGNAVEIKEFAVKEVSHTAARLGVDNIYNWNGGADNPERSTETVHENRSLIGIDAGALEKASEKAGLDKATFGGFLVTHGAGHNSGLGDSNDPAPQDNKGNPISLVGTIMSRGSEVNAATINSITSEGKNQQVIGNYKARFGDNPQKDNYKKNEQGGK